MKTIVEIEEDPIEFVRWSKAKFAEENGYDRTRMIETLKAAEAASRARGIKFVDFSQASVTYPDAAKETEPSILREDPPKLP